jgi:reactive intermediate/imine deaminase
MTRKLLFVTGIVVGLVTGAAVVQVQGQGAARRYINTAGRSDTLPYSNAVLVGNTLYVAGTIGTDPATGNAPADVEKEIRLALDAWKATLAQAGMTMNDVVTVQVFCPDLSLYDKFNGIYRTYFDKDFPARGFIGSGPLLRNGHFEIQGIAVKK